MLQIVLRKLYAPIPGVLRQAVGFGSSWVCLPPPLRPSTLHLSPSNPPLRPSPSPPLPRGGRVEGGGWQGGGGGVGVGVGLRYIAAVM